MLIILIYVSYGIEYTVIIQCIQLSMKHSNINQHNAHNQHKLILIRFHSLLKYRNNQFLVKVCFLPDLHNPVIFCYISIQLLNLDLKLLLFVFAFHTFVYQQIYQVGSREIMRLEGSVYPFVCLQSKVSAWLSVISVGLLVHYCIDSKSGDICNQLCLVVDHM